MVEWPKFTQSIDWNIKEFGLDFGLPDEQNQAIFEYTKASIEVAKEAMNGVDNRDLRMKSVHLGKLYENLIESGIPIAAIEAAGIFALCIAMKKDALINGSVDEDGPRLI